MATVYEEERDLGASSSVEITDYEFRLGAYIRRGFSLFGERAGPFIGFTFVAFLIAVVVGVIPIVGIFSFLVTTPLFAGFFLVARKVDMGEATAFGDFFKGFDHFGQLVLTGLVVGFLTAIGFILLILPGIYLAVAYTFAIPFVLFARREFWESMELSRKVVTRQWFSVFGFLFVLALINIGGAILLGLGLLVTIPVTYCALYAAFDDLCTQLGWQRVVSSR